MSDQVLSEQLLIEFCSSCLDPAERLSHIKGDKLVMSNSKNEKRSELVISIKFIHKVFVL